MKHEARGELIGRLMALFRQGGFEGVSIGDIAAATGLGKSSLYYHFPGGKDEMAAAVLAHVAEWEAAHLIAPLAAPGSRAERIGAMMQSVRTLYDSGRQSCVLASLSMGGAQGARRDVLAQITADWVAALGAALVDTGAEPGAARAAALDALIRIEGALIVTRLLGAPEVFAQTMAALEADLLAA